MSIVSKSEDVKRRTYNSPRRRQQADLTRKDIVEAATRRFQKDGYNGATMAEIAAEAGVVVETIYRNFGGKVGLIEAVVEAAVAGGTARSEVPSEQRPAIKALIEEPDPRRKLDMYAATQPGIHRRAGGLRKALREAATVEPSLQAVHERLESIRLEGMERFAQHLHDSGVLQVGLSITEARDLLWAINSVAMYEALVDDRRWSIERYQGWIASMMKQSLLKPA